MKKEFYRFLAEHGLITEFNRNFSSADNKDFRAINKIPVHKAKFFAKNQQLKPERYISAAFRWNNSPEGLMIWARLDYEWERKLIPYLIHFTILNSIKKST